MELRRAGFSRSDFVPRPSFALVEFKRGIWHRLGARATSSDSDRGCAAVVASECVSNNRLDRRAVCVTITLYLACRRRAACLACLLTLDTCSEESLLFEITPPPPRMHHRSSQAPSGAWTVALPDPFDQGQGIRWLCMGKRPSNACKLGIEVAWRSSSGERRLRQTRS